MAAPSTVVNSPCSHRTRSSVSAAVEPYRKAAPLPSLIAENAWVPNARFSTTKTGVAAVITPPNVHVAFTSAADLSLRRSERAISWAASRLGARPSITSVPTIAPRSALQRSSVGAKGGPA